jgi:hypothetical protein
VLLAHDLPLSDGLTPGSLASTIPHRLPPPKASQAPTRFCGPGPKTPGWDSGPPCLYLYASPGDFLKNQVRKMDSSARRTKLFLKGVDSKLVEHMLLAGRDPEVINLAG